ncbi:MAG: hypothetical protein EHM20_02600 [Alphaproteobacteria bacterium]|nr:MAG: hypothetical protein EHM20_02600 [Alphaproteobacteria bacterium]
MPNKLEVISVFILMISICFMAGCGQKCNPTYLADSSVIEKINEVKGLPIRVSAQENRTPKEKYFLKIGFMTYYEKDGEHFNDYHPVQLGKPSKEIIQTAFGEGFKQCGFTLNDDACVVADISIEKFFCTVSGGKDNEAIIEADLSLREDDKTIYHKHISETYKQKFDAFRQMEDAEPLLSKCLSMAIDKALTDPEFAREIAANTQSFKVIDGKKATLIFNKQLDEEAKKANLPADLTVEFKNAQVSVFDESFFMSSRGEFESNENYVNRSTTLKDKFFVFDTEVKLETYNYDQARFDDISLSTGTRSESDMKWDGISYLSIILNREVLDRTEYKKGIIAKNISVKASSVFPFYSSDAIKFYWDSPFAKIVINIPPKAAEELKSHKLFMSWKVNFPYPLGKHLTDIYPVLAFKDDPHLNEAAKALFGFDKTEEKYVLADVLAAALIDKTENKILAVFSTTKSN